MADQLLVQVTFPAGTGPSLVGVLNVHDTVSTTVPGGCSTVMTALVNATLVMFSVQCEFGQPDVTGEPVKKSLGRR